MLERSTFKVLKTLKVFYCFCTVPNRETLYYQGMIVFKARYYGSVLKCHTGKILDLTINGLDSLQNLIVYYTKSQVVFVTRGAYPLNITNSTRFLVVLAF